MPELGYESPSSKNPKSDPLLLSKDWEVHRARLLEKLSAKNTAELIRIVMSEGRPQ